MWEINTRLNQIWEVWRTSSTTATAASSYNELNAMYYTNSYLAKYQKEEISLGY